MKPLETEASVSDGLAYRDGSCNNSVLIYLGPQPISTTPIKEVILTINGGDHWFNSVARWIGLKIV